MPRWRQCIPTAQLNSHSSRPTPAAFTWRSDCTSSTQQQGVGIHARAAAQVAPGRSPLPPQSLFYPPSHPQSPSSRSDYGSETPCCSSAWKMAWVQGSGGCEKGSFQKNPGLPLKHSHVKWQLPQPIPSLHGKREKCKLQKEVPTPTLLYPPTSTFSPPFLLQSLLPHSVCTNFPSSTVATKMSNYCKTSHIAVQLISSHWVEMHARIAESITVFCVFLTKEGPLWLYSTLHYLQYITIFAKENGECQVCANRICTANFFEEFKKTINDQHGSHKSRCNTNMAYWGNAYTISMQTVNTQNRFLHK